jgi:hypothetical protein
VRLIVTQAVMAPTGFRQEPGKSGHVFFAALVWISVVVSAGPSYAEQAPYTPLAGSAERKAIFNAMRAQGDIHDRVFVLRYLKVQNGWAWLVGDPQSPGGKNHFESESALLRNDGTGWKVLDQPCTEADCDDKKEMARIKAASPKAPAGIFP